MADETKRGTCDTCKKPDRELKLRWAPDFAEEWRPVMQCAECDAYWLRPEEPGPEQDAYDERVRKQRAALGM